MIIPALDEQEAIGKVIGDIPRWVDHIIVADNGSSDKTAINARTAGAIVVDEPERGYGAACLQAMRGSGDTDIIVFLDGDYSDYPAQMDKLVDPIASGSCQFTVGSRVLGKREKGALTPQQRYGNWLACFLIARIWKVKFTDLGPFRAILRQTLDKLDMRERTYGWTVEMQVKAAQAGIPTLEIPVDYRRRIGRSKVSGTIKGTILAGYKILSVIALSALRDRKSGIHAAKQSRLHD